MKRFLPFCYPTLPKDGEEQNCPLWKGNTGMGQSGLCFLASCLITLFPVSGSRRTFPELQGCLVSRTALADPACVHDVHAPCAAAPDRHTQAGTHKQTLSMAKKLSGAFFFQTRIQLVTDRTRFQDWSWMFGMQFNYFNAEKPFRRHRKISEVQLVMSLFSCWMSISHCKSAPQIVLFFRNRTDP